MDIDTLLSAIGSTEETTFNELCQALGDDCPERGNTPEWRDLFRTVSCAEKEGLVRVDRVGGKIGTLILTEAGAARVREKLDRRRGLLNYIEREGEP